MNYEQVESYKITNSFDNLLNKINTIKTDNSNLKEKNAEGKNNLI
jgi:hypothetical protein